MSNESLVLSTGILFREPQTNMAVASIVNLDRFRAHAIEVQVWDWTIQTNPTQLPVLICGSAVTFPYVVSPGTSVVMYSQLASTVTLYEMRILRYSNRSLIVNCFGRGGSPVASQVGNTVLQHSLFEVGFNRR